MLRLQDSCAAALGVRGSPEMPRTQHPGTAGEQRLGAGGARLASWRCGWAGLLRLARLDLGQRWAGGWGPPLGPVSVACASVPWLRVDIATPQAPGVKLPPILCSPDVASPVGTGVPMVGMQVSMCLLLSVPPSDGTWQVVAT